MGLVSGMPKKIPIVKVGIFLLAAPFVALLVLVGLVGTCDENHSAVKRARALAQHELAALYERVMKLKDQFPYETLIGREIPKDLAYLKATYIDVGSEERPVVLVMLAKCDVSEGVNLMFGPSYKDGRKEIVLKWFPADRGRGGSEVLWSE